MVKDKQKEREKEKEKEEGKGGLFGLSLPDLPGRTSSEERRGGGRRSLDALTENFKSKSFERTKSKKIRRLRRASRGIRRRRGSIGGKCWRRRLETREC